VGRVFYSASTAVCTPNAVSQDGGWALGAQAGEAQPPSCYTAFGVQTAVDAE
jgi:hypothetical protein